MVAPIKVDAGEREMVAAIKVVDAGNVVAAIKVVDGGNEDDTGNVVYAGEVVLLGKVITYHTVIRRERARSASEQPVFICFGVRSK